jgi:phosphatidylglycerophosphate synthase
MMTELRAGASVPAGPRLRVGPALAAGGAGVAALLLALPYSGPVPWFAASALYAAVAGVVLARFPAGAPDRRFGAANAVTLARAVGVAGFAAIAAAPGLPAGPASWGAFGAAAALVALDGLDGWAARRQGLVSAFGARFDMEVDALFILMLSILAVRSGKAGPWVLGLGLLRYAFVLLGMVRPRFARPLPPSFRRKAVCVLQMAVLALLLAPPLAPPLSSALAGFAFAALVWSFAADLRWLRVQAT